MKKSQKEIKKKKKKLISKEEIKSNFGILGTKGKLLKALKKEKQ